MYKYVDKVDTAEVYLYGVIGEDFWGEGNSAKSFVEQLSASSPKPLDIHIDSGGGDVFDGFAMASAIQRYEGETTAYVDGLAASAASYIAVACDNVRMNDYSWMMVHRASTCAYGNVDDLLNVANRLEAIDSTIADIYAKRTGIDRDEIVAAMEAETWLSAQDALDGGWCTEVIETEQRMAACVDEQTASRYRNRPANVHVISNKDEQRNNAMSETILDWARTMNERINSDAEAISHATDTLESDEETAKDAGYFAIDGKVYRKESR